MRELKQFGINLRDARMMKGLTQEYLGRLVNTDNHYINCLELGLVDPSMMEVQALAIALEISVCDLIDNINLHPLIKEVYG